ncbi:MAG: hypothetical protein P4L22_04045 [Candidatus Babeliales bacterium]|nr:hypothetical protein [Candidatus Babeliales bacterium]
MSRERDSRSKGSSRTEEARQGSKGTGSHSGRKSTEAEEMRQVGKGTDSHSGRKSTEVRETANASKSKQGGKSSTHPR